MKTYKTTESIERKAKTLKASTFPGWSNDGQRVVVKYSAVTEPDAQARSESALARRQGLDLDVLSGIVDRVWKSGKGLCITILALERVNLEARSYCYRTLRVSRIVSLTA